jgi:hypothetical protein
MSSNPSSEEPTYRFKRRYIPNRIPAGKYLAVVRDLGPLAVRDRRYLRITFHLVERDEDAVLDLRLDENGEILETWISRWERLCVAIGLDQGDEIPRSAFIYRPVVVVIGDKGYINQTWRTDRHETDAAMECVAEKIANGTWKQISK